MSGAEGVAQERVEALGVLLLGHHAAAVEDFEAGAWVEREELAGLVEGVGRVLLAPGERDGLAQAREGLADVRVEVAGKKGRGRVLRAGQVADGVVVRDESRRGE